MNTARHKTLKYEKEGEAQEVKKGSERDNLNRLCCYLKMEQNYCFEPHQSFTVLVSLFINYVCNYRKLFYKL